MRIGRVTGLLATLSAAALGAPPAFAVDKTSISATELAAETRMSVSGVKSKRSNLKLRGPEAVSPGVRVLLQGKLKKNRGKRVRIRIQLARGKDWKRVAIIRTSSQGKFRARVAVAAADIASFRATTKLKRRSRSVISNTVTVKVNHSQEETDTPAVLPPTPESDDTSIPTPGSAMTAQELSMVKLVNDARAVGRSCGKYGYFGAVPSLRPNKKLADAAKAHSDDMLTNDFFSHTSSNGDEASDRIERQGYRWSTWGENIAWGYPDAAAATQALIDSPGHCRNIMNPSFKEIGVGVATDGSQRSRIYWTQNFGTPRR